MVDDHGFHFNSVRLFPHLGQLATPPEPNQKIISKTRLAEGFSGINLYQNMKEAGVPADIIVDYINLLRIYNT